MEYDHRLSGSPSTPPPLKHKHHHLCFSSCFRPSTSDDALAPAGSLDSKTHEMPEFRSKCLSFVSRSSFSGRGSRAKHHHHRRYRSADFKYDALSYSRNFDDGTEDDASTDEEASRHRWVSRLPASPLGESRFKEGLPAQGEKATDAFL